MGESEFHCMGDVYHTCEIYPMGEMYYVCESNHVDEK